MPRRLTLGALDGPACWGSGLLPFLLPVALLSASSLRAAAPALHQILPRGVQRGGDAVLTFQGDRLADAADVLIYSEGIALSKLEVENDKQVKASIVVAGDCRLGEHAVRLRTTTGLSELRTFFVGAFPQIAETEPNGDFTAPQKTTLNVTISGVIRSEDVDHFAFEAKKGDRVSAEVEAMRLAGGVFDPYLAILNAARFELAACDDAPLLQQDAFVSVVIPEDGTYIVQVRECAYGGSDGSLYRLHVGTFPRPVAVYPPGGKSGEELEVSFLGDPTGDIRKRVKVPGAARGFCGLHADDAHGIAPSPNLFRVSSLGNVLEAEPNDSREQATAGDLSSAFNGILSRPGDIDFFRFAAKKGQVLDVHLYGRRIRSPIDSVVMAGDAGGAVLASNDDAIGPDSYLRFTAPDDKEYWVSVADHLGKGGPACVYRLELTPVAPRVTLSFPKVSQFSQERQTVVVPRGNRYAALVSASREDFGGDIALAAADLPQGVTAREMALPSSLGAAPVLFEAAPDAPLSGSVFRLTGRPADPVHVVSFGFAQDVELVVGGPGQSVYWSYIADRPAIAVADDAPFRIQIVEPRVPLVQNGSMALKVVAERLQGFASPIALQMVYNPPGVSSGGDARIAEGQTEATIPLNAGGGAPAQEWKIAVTGTAAVGGGPVCVSSQLATLKIAPAPFTLAVDRGTVEQAKETEVLCKVEHHAPFAGAAKVELLGLPPGVTAEPFEVTKETAEVALKIAAGLQTPPGTHRGLFCRVVVTQEGESIVYGSGGTEVRVDPPPPPKPGEPPKPPEVAAEKKEEPRSEAPKPPPTKPLTRLEKLRLEVQGKAGPKETGVGGSEVQK